MRFELCTRCRRLPSSGESTLVSIAYDSSLNDQEVVLLPAVAQRNRSSFSFGDKLTRGQWMLLTWTIYPSSCLYG
jgi:hypothetical protein